MTRKVPFETLGIGAETSAGATRAGSNRGGRLDLAPLRTPAMLRRKEPALLAPIPSYQEENPRRPRPAFFLRAFCCSTSKAAFGLAVPLDPWPSRRGPAALLRACASGGSSESSWENARGRKSFQTLVGKEHDSCLRACGWRKSDSHHLENHG